MIRIKRVYEEFRESDGNRILVDRLWPRGISKEKAAIAHWLKQIAPSAELRKWFDHDPQKFEQFKQKYMIELQNNPEQMEAVNQLKPWLEEGDITLVYGAKDEQHNQAVVLKEYLESKKFRGEREQLASPSALL